LNHLSLQARETLLSNVKPIALALAFLVLGMSISRCTPPPPAPAASVVSEAPVNPIVVSEKKVDTPILSPNKTVRTYGTAAKGLITLPKTIAEDDSKRVTDSVVLQSTEKRQVVTQVLDVGTGETTSYTHTVPDPWVAPESRGSLGLTYGLKRDSVSPVFQLHGRHDFLQTKRLHWGVSGTAYSDGDWYAGAGAEVSW
jgi:hypothetical protein